MKIKMIIRYLADLFALLSTWFLIYVFFTIFLGG